jgi:hypothetical protein
LQKVHPGAGGPVLVDGTGIGVANRTPRPRLLKTLRAPEAFQLFGPILVVVYDLQYGPDRESWGA